MGLKRSLRNVSVGIDAIPDSVVDNFESVDSDPAGVYETGETLDDYYNGGLAEWSRNTSDVVEGDKNVEAEMGDNVDHVIISQPGDGLNRYPEAEDTLVSLMWDSGGSGDSGNGGRPMTCFNGSWENDAVDCYAAYINAESNTLEIIKYDGQPGGTGFDNKSTLESENVTLSDEEWYWVEIDIPADSGTDEGDIEVRIYDVNTADLTRGSELGSVTTTDTDFVDNRGVGVSFEQADRCMVDFLHIAG